MRTARVLWGSRGRQMSHCRDQCAPFPTQDLRWLLGRNLGLGFHNDLPWQTLQTSPSFSARVMANNCIQSLGKRGQTLPKVKNKIMTRNQSCLEETGWHNLWKTRTMKSGRTLLASYSGLGFCKVITFLISINPRGKVGCALNTGSQFKQESSSFLQYIYLFNTLTALRTQEDDELFPPFFH